MKYYTRPTLDGRIMDGVFKASRATAFSFSSPKWGNVRCVMIAAHFRGGNLYNRAQRDKS